MKENELLFITEKIIKLYKTDDQKLNRKGIKIKQETYNKGKKQKITIQVIKLLFVEKKMQKHFRVESSPRWPRVMTERASTQEDHAERSTTHAKIKFNHKSLGRGVNMKQPVTEYQSQHYSRNYHNNKQNKPQFTESKIHRNLSYSKKTSKKQNKPSNQEQNEDFLIRIPKNEDMIENYIQQLKQLKRKVFQQKQKEPQTIRNELRNTNNGSGNVKLLQKSKQKLQFIKDSENIDNKPDEFLLKLPGKKEQQQGSVQNKDIGRVSSIDDKKAIKQIRKTEEVRGQRGSGNGSQQQKMIFCRDIKKHIKKLKMFKQYVDENQQYNNNDDENANDNANEYYDELQCMSGKRNLINHPQNQPNNKAFHHRSPNTSKFISPYISQPQSQRYINKQSTSIPLFNPKKVLYGNVIHFKQEFMVEPSCLETATNKRFHRYSSQLGVAKKLSMVSKSIDMRGEEKTTGRSKTEENNEKTEKSKSLVLRRKTQQHKRTKKQQNFHINNKFPLRQINIQNSTENTPPQQQKPQTQRSPTKQKSPSKLKNNTSPQKNPHPFKSIQGFSTIQEHKETLDILGESCFQIKNNLIESHKKMDHILDLLQGNMIELEGNGHKERKRKSSYERFSKAFPKDFFK